MKMLKMFGLVMVGILLLSSCKTKNNKVDVENLNWLKMGEVESAVKNDSKKILVDVYTSWCGPCKMLDKNTFNDPEVKSVFAHNFHIVKFDAEGAEPIDFMGKTYSNPKHQPGKRGRNSAHELTRMFNVRGYPTVVVMDENMKIVDKIVGYKKPEEFLEALKKHM